MLSLSTQYRKIALKDYILVGLLVFSLIAASSLCVFIYKRSLCINDLIVRYKYSTYSAVDAGKKLIDALNSLPTSERRKITTKLNRAASEISAKMEAVWLSGKPIVCEIGTLPVKELPVLKKAKVRWLFLKEQRVEISYGNSFHDIIPLSKCYALFPNKEKDSTFYARSIIIKYPLHNPSTSNTALLNRDSAANLLLYLANAYFHDDRFASYRKHVTPSGECKEVMKEADRLVKDTTNLFLLFKVPLLKRAIECKHDYLNNYYTFEAKVLIDFLKSASVDDIERVITMEKIFMVKPADRKNTIFIPVKKLI